MNSAESSVSGQESPDGMTDLVFVGHDRNASCPTTTERGSATGLEPATSGAVSTPSDARGIESGTVGGRRQNRTCSSGAGRSSWS